MKRGLDTEEPKQNKKQKGEDKESKSSTEKYLSGFGAEHSSEALPGALPKGHFMPQKCPYGLYAEQMSGTPFTAPRKENQRCWVYRIYPSAKQTEFKSIDEKTTKIKAKDIVGHFGPEQKAIPNQLRWLPFALPASDSKVDFVQGLKTLGGAGSPDMKTGMAVHIYCCNQSMENKAFCSADGDFLIVPQQGTLRIQTELGWLTVAPGEIAVIQRGWRWSVNVTETSRGFIAEVYDGHFKLPELGPIGTNGLANARDFLHPVAAYENRECDFKIIQKFSGGLFETTLNHSCFDVVAWTGSYAPYKYDLSLFCPVNSVRYDHMDPSIFTVLTCPTNAPGVAACDFVIFPPRWAVQEDTFRPPYYHRNCMSEFMGNIRGRYDAKPTGFLPGGATLHSMMTPHGPDSDAFEKASSMDTTKPTRMPDDCLAFMFESTYLLRLTDWALKDCELDKEYITVWAPLRKKFDPTHPIPAL